MKNNYSLLTGFIFFVTLSFSQTPIKLSNDQFEFTEGPVWDGIDNIYFSDVRAATTYKYSISADEFTVTNPDSNRGNGMMFNAENDLIICEGSRMQKRSITGEELETVAGAFNGAAFNGLNDLCIDKRGGIYFTDPTFFANQPQGTNRVYYRDPDGTITALIDFGNENPNGIIISPDGTKLYVNNTSSLIVRRYDIAPDGSISNKMDFATLANPDNDNVSGADGMAVDTDGNLYVADKVGIQIFDDAGNLLNTISFPDIPTNCTFGGEDKNILFVTARTNFYKVDFPGVTGIRHPFDLPEVPLSTTDFSLEKAAVKLYPNPLSANVFSIDFLEEQTIKSIVVIDGLGKQIETTSFSISGKKTKVELTRSLQSGIYQVSITTNKGVANTKLVIQ